MNLPRMNMSLVAGLLALLMAAGGGVAWAQEKPRTANIAVLDVQHLMQHSVAVKNANAQIEMWRTGHQKEVKGQLEGIKKLYEGIAQERSTLSENAYLQRLLGLRKKAASYQIEAQNSEGEMNDALAEALGKISGTIEQIVSQIIKERKFSVVLPRASIIGTPAVPDITQEVLKRLNQRMPSVAVDIPK